MKSVIQEKKVYRLRILSDHWIFEDNDGIIVKIGHVKETFPYFSQQGSTKEIIVGGTPYSLTDKQYKRLLKDIKRESFITRWKNGIWVGFLTLTMLSIYTFYHVAVFTYQYYSPPVSKPTPIINPLLLQNQMVNPLSMPHSAQPLNTNQGLGEDEFWNSLGQLK